MFIATDIAIGRTVSCIPINHPFIDNVTSSGGIPQTHILKYMDAASVTSALGSMMPRKSCNKGLRTATMTIPRRNAIDTARQKTVLHLSGFREPYASAVSPVVPILRKPHSHRMTLKIVPPAATAARKMPLPRCPVIAVSQSPSKGTVILLAIAGNASRKMVRSICVYPVFFTHAKLIIRVKDNNKGRMIFVPSEIFR